MNEEWVFVGEFAARVLNYVKQEWQLDLFQFQKEHQEWALHLVAELKGKESVPNIAAKIAMGLPL